LNYGIKLEVFLLLKLLRLHYESPDLKRETMKAQRMAKGVFGNCNFPKPLGERLMYSDLSPRAIFGSNTRLKFLIRHMDWLGMNFLMAQPRERKKHD
jgi:hypothetical protein